MIRAPFTRSLFVIAAVAVHCSIPPDGRPDQPAVVHSPVSPQEALQYFVLPADLRVELVAHEPNVIDPVAIRFDEDGRMWVVEMRDYPTAKVTGNAAGSRISLLRDDNDDGFYETATVFADDLRYATGVQPWKGGVFVTMAGEVAYLKDTNGDDRADLRESWYTGFSEKNQQLRANHPQLAIDNHIYVANGLRGGEIIDARRPHADPLSISGMDFRFDPFTRAFEAVSGVGQFGLTFDDFGNRFVCSNRNPAMHVVLEDRYVRKNPLFAATAVSTDVAKAGAESRIFPVARAWTTSHLHAGQFTAACGVNVYRGDALPPEYGGNLFVCEPTGHLVHREIMRPNGVSFTSVPARAGIEFLASRDEWCSPVNLDTGPDGALYVVDMYRAVIEHPHWMPEELRQRPDLVDGNDRGRIYRLVPKDFDRPAVPRLSALSSELLVGELTHPNAWRRETAARLLLERQDKSIGPLLEQVVLEHRSPAVRIQSLRLLEGLDLLREQLLQQLLTDAQPRVVEHAVLAAESKLAGSSDLRNIVSKLIDSDDARIRFIALLTATPLPSPPSKPADRWLLDAMMIAAGDRGGEVLATMLQHPAELQANVADPKQFVIALAHLAAASGDDRQHVAAVAALLGDREFGRAGLSSVLSEIARHDGSLDGLVGKLGDATRRELDREMASANTDAADIRLSDEVRCEAIGLVALTRDAVDALVPLALDEPRQAVRVRAIEALANRQTLEPWTRLLDQFAHETPSIQRAVLDGVLANENRTSLLLDEIAGQRIKPQELDAARTKRLLDHSNAEIKSRAARLFAASLPADREQALAKYRVVLTMVADSERGRSLFGKHCAACHLIDGVGVAFAPDISDSREKAPEQLLTDIIQPNRAIDSNYFSYTAVTVDGRTHTGVLAAETSTSVTLRQAEGKSVTLLRDEIDELRSDGVSFMPDGLENNIPPQDMADLIGFIKNWRYLGRPATSSAAAP